MNLIENNPEYEKYQKSPVLPYINRLSDFFVLSRRLDELRKLDEQTWETRKKDKINKFSLYLHNVRD